MIFGRPFFFRTVKGTLTFGGDKQRLLLQLLFAAYWSGSPVLRVAAVLEGKREAETVQAL